jgi:hypothetical protein
VTGLTPELLVGLGLELDVAPDAVVVAELVEFPAGMVVEGVVVVLDPALTLAVRVRARAGS